MKVVPESNPGFECWMVVSLFLDPSVSLASIHQSKLTPLTYLSVERRRSMVLGLQEALTNFAQTEVPDHPSNQLVMIVLQVAMLFLSYDDDTSRNRATQYSAWKGVLASLHQQQRHNTQLAALVHNLIAVSCFCLARHKESLEHIDRAIELCPLDAQLFHNKGAICHQALMPSSITIDLYTRAIELNPTSASYYNRAFERFLLRQFGKAAHDFAMATDLDPSCSSMHGLSLSCYQMGRLIHACHFFQHRCTLNICHQHCLQLREELRNTSQDKLFQ